MRLRVKSKIQLTLGTVPLHSPFQLLVIQILAATVLAQTAPDQPAPMSNTGAVTWDDRMGHSYVDGRFWFKAESPAASIVVSVSDTGQYLAASVGIRNLSTAETDVVPGQFELNLIAPGKTPKPLAYISPESVIRSLYQSLDLSQVDDAIAAMSATKTETTTSQSSGTIDVNGPEIGHASGTYDGSTVTTRQVTDERKLEQIQEARQQREQTAQNNASDVNTNGLRATTLEPGDEIRGLVFFKRERSCGSRKGCTLQLILPVGDTTFEFPVSFNRR